MISDEMKCAKLTLVIESKICYKEGGLARGEELIARTAALSMWPHIKGWLEDREVSIRGKVFI